MSVRAPGDGGRGGGGSSSGEGRQSGMTGLRDDAVCSALVRGNLARPTRRRYARAHADTQSAATNTPKHYGGGQPRTGSRSPHLQGVRE